jgi:quinol monooxygenase YgiN
MLALVVRFQIQPGLEAAFDTLVAQTVARIRTEEPGTLLYLCHRVEAEPTARIFYELYRDLEAFQAHEEQPHIKAFHAERKQHMAGPDRVEFLGKTDGKGWPAA